MGLVGCVCVCFWSFFASPNEQIRCFCWAHFVVFAFAAGHASSIRCFFDNSGLGTPSLFVVLGLSGLGTPSLFVVFGFSGLGTPSLFVVFGPGRCASSLLVVLGLSGPGTLSLFVVLLFRAGHA